MDRVRNVASAESSLGYVVAEILEQSGEFIHTRLEMLQTELQENFHSWKVALPVAGAALVLLGTAYILFAAALVALIAVLLPPTAFRWVIALAVVAFVWSIPGTLMAFFAVQKLNRPPLVPRKTLGVLKADREWLESEIRAA
jgi:uncharacterized membrane protein YqjE